MRSPLIVGESERAVAAQQPQIEGARLAAHAVRPEARADRQVDLRELEPEGLRLADLDRGAPGPIAVRLPGQEAAAGALTEPGRRSRDAS